MHKQAKIRVLIISIKNINNAINVCIIFIKNNKINWLTITVTGFQATDGKILAYLP